MKRDDGIIRFLQANAIEFSDRHTLPNIISDLIQQRNWNPNWRNELVLEAPTWRDAHHVVQGRPVMPARFFHIDVRNLHREKLATNCYVYLESAAAPGDTYPAQNN